MAYLYAQHINFLDVKELYDLAYADLHNKDLMAQAVKTDMLYRMQLKRETSQLLPHTHYKAARENLRLITPFAQAA